MITLPLPPSINATYKRGRYSFYKSEEAKSWEENAGFELKKQWHHKNQLEGKLHVRVWWFFKRERDISSGLKILEDLLQNVGVYKNDSQIYEEVIFKDFDKENPRVEIEVVELYEE